MRGKGKSRRVRRSPGEWASLFTEQVASGLSQRAFCAERHLSVSSFCNARRRLDGARLARVAADATGDSEFIEVAVDAAPVDGWMVELTLGAGVVLRVRRW